MKLTEIPTDLAGFVKDGYARGWSFVRLNGKVPIDKGWQKAERATLDEAWKWIAAGHNVGLRCGQASGIVVIDVDEGGDITSLDLPGTMSVKTGRGGMHLYYRYRDKLGNSSSKLGPHIDVRGDGGQVVYPGSIHPQTGQRYEWIEGHAPWEIEIAELPQAIVEKLQTKPGRGERASAAATPERMHDFRTRCYVDRAIKDELDAVISSGNGQRNDSLNRAAFAIGQFIGGGHLARADAEERLTMAAVAVGLGEGETRATIESGLNAGEREPRTVELDDRPGPTITTATAPATSKRPLELSDCGNALRLVQHLAGRGLYCDQTGLWYLWDGCRFAPDVTRRIEVLAKQAVDTIWGEMQAVDDRDMKDCLYKHWRKSQQRDRLRAMIDLARCEVAVTQADLDADDWKLNLANGTLCLRTGRLLPHDPEDKISKLAPVSYDPAARCDRWFQFLDEIMAGDAALIQYLQQVAGLCLTGDISEQLLFIAHGTGANGKSVFWDSLSQMLGDYACQGAPELLVASDFSRHPTEVADLAGRRLVVAAETESGQALRIQLIKQVTGDSTLKARLMRQDFFEFRRTNKMVLLTNHLPAVEDDGHAIWRRLRKIPFTVTIPDNRQDKRLLEKLRAEWSGILSWCLQGCLAWQKHGLSEPAAVTVATADYAENEHPLTEFFTDVCTFDPMAETAVSVLNTYYTKWAVKKGNLRPISPKKFNAELRKRGCLCETVRETGYIYKAWIGIGLQNNE